MKRCLLLFLAVLATSHPVAGDVAYWVWERTKPLSAQEAAQLKAADVSRLYWQAGTMTTDGAHWKWRERFPIDWTALHRGGTTPAIIPVLRLEPPEGQGLPETTFPELEAMVNALIEESGGKEMQIDYECPDRLVPNYIRFLRHLKESGRTWRLSISALGHWSKYADQFSGLADEITPMFYDLNPHRESLGAGMLPPLLNVTSVASEITGWKNCPLPWRAGLPNFSRLTLVDKSGLSLGNIRRWGWDDIWFSPMLKPASTTVDGETCFDVQSTGVMASTPMQPGEHVVARHPDRDALQSVLSTVATSGAEGPIYFRLAGADDMSGFSPLDLAQEKIAPPKFRVQSDASSRIILTNVTATDLMPRVFGDAPGQRGYCLVLRAESSIWRDVLPGEFSAVSAGNDYGMDGVTLRFRFSHLAAGQSIKTGLAERAPLSGSALVSWRIDNVDKENVWHELESAQR